MVERRDRDGAHVDAPFAPIDGPCRGSPERERKRLGARFQEFDLELSIAGIISTT
jgi:hypothetical protein